MRGPVAVPAIFESRTDESLVGRMVGRRVFFVSSIMHLLYTADSPHQCARTLRVRLRCYVCRTAQHSSQAPCRDVMAPRLCSYLHLGTGPQTHEPPSEVGFVREKGALQITHAGRSEGSTAAEALGATHRALDGRLRTVGE